MARIDVGHRLEFDETTGRAVQKGGEVKILVCNSDEDFKETMIDYNLDEAVAEIRGFLEAKAGHRVDIVQVMGDMASSNARLVKDDRLSLTGIYMVYKDGDSIYKIEMLPQSAEEIMPIVIKEMVNAKEQQPE